MTQKIMTETVSAALPSTSTLYLGDCLTILDNLKKQVALVFADLPYGVSSCAWDCKVDIDRLAAALEPMLHKNAYQIFTAVQPFTTSLMNSMEQNFRHDLIWQRTRPTGFFSAKKAPLRSHEHVLVFGRQPGTYNPVFAEGKSYCVTTKSRTSEFYGSKDYKADNTHKGQIRYPRSIINVNESDLRNDGLNGRTERRLHPTQKPVALLEWLIATYTNPGDTILDPVFGSATTGAACARLGRHFIGIEKDPEYFRIGRERVDAERAKLGLQPCEVFE